MPKVTNPANGATKSDSTFQWDMEGISYNSSKVIVGSIAGSDSIYTGTEFPKGTLKDPGVPHPRNGSTCFTRPKYRKLSGGAWYTTNSIITSFISK